MESLEILKMIPAYLVPAAIVVWLGMRMLEKRDAQTLAMANDFAAKIETAHKEHRGQIDRIVDQFSETQAQWQVQQKLVIDDYIAITKETVIAVKGLESSVRELKEYVTYERRKLPATPKG